MSAVPPNSTPQQPFPPQEAPIGSTRHLPPPQKVGAVPPPQQKKSGRIGWIIGFSVLGGVLLLLGIVGSIVYTFATSVVNTTLSPTLSSSKYYSQYPETSGPGSTVNVGQTITVGDLSCTLTSATTLAGDAIVQPSTGNTFLLVHVKLVNGANHELQYDPFNFHVKTGMGSITDEEFVSPTSYTANNRLSVGKLTPGGSVDGDIILQVPFADHRAQLVWNPSILDSTTKYAWNL